MVTITTFLVEMLGVGYILYVVLKCHKIRKLFKGQTVFTELILTHVHSSEKVSTLALVYWLKQTRFVFLTLGFKSKQNNTHEPLHHVPL